MSGTALYTLETGRISRPPNCAGHARPDQREEQADNGHGTWAPLQFSLAPPDKVFGSKLTIEAPTRPANIMVTYRTSPDASVLQWLEPAMTEGKKRLSMFSQSQAIHARSWVPAAGHAQRALHVYAHITTRPDVMVLMSADNDPKATRNGTYVFNMPQPIPSYLLAIAAGDLVFKPSPSAAASGPSRRWWTGLRRSSKTPKR